MQKNWYNQFWTLPALSVTDAYTTHLLVYTMIKLLLLLQACGLHNQVMTLGQLLKTNSATLAVLLMKTIAMNYSIPAYRSVIKIKKN